MVVALPVRLYREGVADALRRDGERFDVVGTSTDAETDLETIVSARPQVVVLDAALPRCTAAVRALAAADAAIRVVALAVAEVESDVIPLAEAGVAGYVTVDQSVDQLAATIEAVVHGELFCSPSVSAMLLRRVALLAGERRPRATEAAGLTSRELEILELIDRGMPNKEIARSLHIALSTVKHHVHNILEKLQVEGRVEAARRLRV